VSQYPEPFAFPTLTAVNVLNSTTSRRYGWGSVIDTKWNAPHRLASTGWPSQIDPRRAKYTAQRAAPLRQLSFPKVERLFITQCFYVNDDNVLEICRRFPNLRELSLKDNALHKSWSAKSLTSKVFGTLLSDPDLQRRLTCLSVLEVLEPLGDEDSYDYGLDGALRAAGVFTQDGAVSRHRTLKCLLVPSDVGMCPWNWCAAGQGCGPVDYIAHNLHCLTSKRNYGISWAFGSREKLWHEHGGGCTRS
jgi:hypothetical protein